MSEPASFVVREDRARSLLRERFGELSNLHLEARELRGGLESRAVVRAVARFRDAEGHPRSWSWVVKRISAERLREVAVYRRLPPRGGALHYAPELLAIEEDHDGGAILHLEWIRPVRRWPWEDMATAKRVTSRLAQIHWDVDAQLGAAKLPCWDYEGELAWSAVATVETVEQLPDDDSLRAIRRGLPAVRRMAEAAPRIRREIACWDGGSQVWIHGDLHPGNVLLRRTRGQSEPVLLDWARVRRGSRLEDLSSWVLSLTHWVPEARRRHDTLLRKYMEGSGGAGRLGGGFRDAYWLAGACNALAGALRYQIVVACESPSQVQRGKAMTAACRWMRTVRRADARFGWS